MELLPLLIFIIPVIGIAAVSLIADRRMAARVALVVSLLSLGDILWKLTSFDPNGGMQFGYDQWWVAQIGVSLLLVLTGLVW
jgi:hypothetical protein